MAVAVCAALAICQFWKLVPEGEQLIRVQAAQALGVFGHGNGKIVFFQSGGGRHCQN